ncbi:DUF3488 and transglutaminase-like domain-containing protein [Frondihabitans sucicola]|uniref:transglutaminase family protein n=1 Tax=Frondihabitans sucicola TaxID=1268041 RepID=UPI00257292D9|nr:DUF3488 and transglutaminase-like domain-containing protein [Frondihabitans sucicola]
MPLSREPGDRFAPGNARWPLTALLWLTLMMAVGSLHPLFQGSGWWFAAAVVSALVLGAAGAARAAHWPSVVASAAGLIVGVLGSTAFVSGGTALLGIIPTAETIDRIRVLTEQARDAIVSDEAPIVVGDAMLGVIVVTVAAGALLVDLLSRVSRMPGLTGVVFAIVLVVPSFIPDVDPSWVWVVLTVLGYVAVLVVSTGRRPSRTSIVTAVAAVVVAGVVTSLLPVSLASPLSNLGTGTGISTGVNPVINLGKDLRRGTAVDVLSYTSSSAQGDYLKLVDLVDFSGTRWSPASVRLDGKNTVEKLPQAPGIAKSTRRDTVTTDVSVNLLRSPYLPIPVPATAITGVDSKWKYVDASGVTVRSTSEGSQGLDYKVTSRPVDPTRSQIVRSLDKAPAGLSAYESVAGVPASITRLAKKVTSGAANPFDAAVQLQDYFRNGEFTYSEDTPVREGYDGSGLDMVETFLKRKSGYCVHFASAMAVMARTLGIPSRIAVGFLPGTQEGSSENWTVTSNDLHTWPELYFQGLGWIPFEPTVGQGTTSSYLQQTGTEATPSSSATSSASASDSATAQATTSTTAAPTTAQVTTSASAATGTSGRSVGGAPFAVVGAAILVLVALLPWWLRTSRRRRRLGQDPPDTALWAWREVVDTARDLGVSVDPAATPQATAALVRERLDAPGASALERLLAGTQRERFGDLPAGAIVQDDARTVIRSLRQGAGPVARCVAALVPRSLFVEARPQTAQGA